jgi:formamidopyrimidine-DNA glycosylase
MTAMIELPEAHVISQQITAELQGKRIRSAVRGNTPHKFAFYTAEPEGYARTLRGLTVGAAEARASCLIVAMEPGWAVVLGDGGERILYHPSAATLPKKHHFLLEFEDDTYLSVAIQGWGAVQMVPRDQVATETFARARRPMPLDDSFTLTYLRELLGDISPEVALSIKAAVISKPGICGVGNGYLQDILYHARLHPRRRAGTLTAAELKALHKSARLVIRQATRAGGRDTERDLYGAPGRYVRLLDARTVGQPCPACQTPFEKISFLGGSCYFCPTCQPLS